MTVTDQGCDEYADMQNEFSSANYDDDLLALSTDGETTPEECASAVRAADGIADAWAGADCEWAEHAQHTSPRAWNARPAGACAADAVPTPTPAPAPTVAPGAPTALPVPGPTPAPAQPPMGFMSALTVSGGAEFNDGNGRTASREAKFMATISHFQIESWLFWLSFKSC